MSNMYKWDGEKPLPTWNPLAGRCFHKCGYGYCNPEKQRWKATKEKYSGRLRIHEPAMNGNPGKGTIFVCSMNDLFARIVPKEFIDRILAHAKSYPDNTYLFQTKNPVRMFEFIDKLPPNYILGTTIETNRHYEDSNAPSTQARAVALERLPRPKMINIEPVMDFDIREMIELMLIANPDFISIGADSKNCELPEPSSRKLNKLIKALRKDGGDVRLKENLERLL